MDGWDSVRVQRYRRQKEMGLFDTTPALAPRDCVVPAWETLDFEIQEEMDLKMAMYAAQIACMDCGIGRVM